MEKQNKNLNGESKNNEKNYMIGKKKKTPTGKNYLKVLELNLKTPSNKNQHMCLTFEHMATANYLIKNTFIRCLCSQKILVTKSLNYCKAE